MDDECNAPIEVFPYLPRLDNTLVSNPHLRPTFVNGAGFDIINGCKLMPPTHCSYVRHVGSSTFALFASPVDYTVENFRESVGWAWDFSMYLDSSNQLPLVCIVIHTCSTLSRKFCVVRKEPKRNSWSSVYRCTSTRLIEHETYM